MTLIRTLDELAGDDVATAGGKGARLGELIRGGFDVPEGFVVSTQAYDAYVQALGLREAILTLAGANGGEPAPDAGQRIRALFHLPPPAGVAREVVAAYEALGAGAVVAVRSSATAEDTAESSFAGQQDTYLGVHGADAVLDAVRRCWASLWTDRAIAYRAHTGVDQRGVTLAVVVQRLVDADAAGIMFTANPATGRRTETVINAAFGFGEAVVAGEVTPDELVVADGAVVARTTADKAVRSVVDASGSHVEAVPQARRAAPVLSDDQALALAALGRRIERHFRSPQDVEWVLSSGRFWVVQSRPITALPEPTGAAPTRWDVPRHDGMYIRASIVEQLPDPLSPLFADLLAPAVERSIRAVLVRFLGADLLRDGDVEFTTVNGYAYYFYSNAAMARLVALVPRALPMVFQRGHELNGARYWRTTGLPTYRSAVREWAGRDERGMSAAELLEGVAALVDAGAVYYTSVQTVIPQTASAEIAFTSLYDSLARRPGDPPATTFLLGFESAPVRAERSLHALAAWCRDTPGVADAVGAGRPVPTEHRAAFDERLAAHLAAHGHLTYNLDLVQPVPADDPAPVLVALRFAISGAAPDPDVRVARLAEERARAERALFTRLDPLRRSILRRALTAAQDVAPLREDALAAIGLGWPAARRFVRELGARLVDSGVIEARDDVFWLTRAEVEASASDPRPLTDRVATRREEWRGRRLVTPPGWLPAEGFWYGVFRSMMPGNEAVQEGPTLRGLGASAGRVRAPARVVTGPEDFGTMQPGEILVAAITTPAYTPFFAMAAGVVTDIGGPLSHSSIVAREYGIPAVLGTGAATGRIRTGDWITVDGDRGLVTLGDEAPVDLPRRRPSARTVAGLAGLGVGTAVAGLALARRRRRRTG